MKRMLLMKLCTCLLFTFESVSAWSPSNYANGLPSSGKHGVSSLGRFKGYSAIMQLGMSNSYVPPDFTIMDENDDDYDKGDGGDSVFKKSKNRFSSPDISSVDSEDRKFDKRSSRDERPNYPYNNRRTTSSTGSRGTSWNQRNSGGERSYSNNENRRKSPYSVSKGPSWMQRNSDFAAGGNEQAPWQDRGSNRFQRRQPVNQGERSRSGTSRSFREDFTGTRVFVKGIPADASWQDLKDHFRVAGEVVFASISQDPVTGESRGHGIVQFETTDMAQNAITVMRDHPMNGQVLYVREDVKQGDEGATLRNRDFRSSTSSIPAWSCADEDNLAFLSDSDRTEVLSLIKARDDARRRKNFDVSDNIRDELKLKFGVHIDDRLKMWWVSIDGKDIPQKIQEIKGQGRWGPKKQEPWRQVPTTPENDACVNPDLVQGLLAQRDIARREKDFQTADALLEQARTSPDGDLYLRIHDESRTWRVWTEEPPPKPTSPRPSPAEQCIAIIQEHAPEKLKEVEALLENFQGREYSILKKLKQRYLK